MRVITSYSIHYTKLYDENLIDIYRLAQEKDPQLLAVKAQRDQAFEKINEAQAANLPQINLGANLDYQKSDQSDRQTAGVAAANLGLSQALYRRSNWLNSDISSKAATQADVGYNLEKQGLILRCAQAYFAVFRITSYNVCYTKLLRLLVS